MGFLSGISYFGHQYVTTPFSALYEWFNPSIPTSNLALIYQLADQALAQNEGDVTGNYHYVSLVDDGSLELKSLKGTEHSSLDQIKAFVFSFFKRASSSQRQKNQQTWELFKKEIIARAGQEQFDWICRHYKTQLPLKSLESGNPLLIRYIKVFYVGLSQLNIDWLEKQRPQLAPLSRLTCKKLTSCVLEFYKAVTATDLESAQSRPLSRLSARPAGVFLSLGSLYHSERSALGILWSQLDHFQPITTERIENSSPLSPLKTRFVSWLEEFCKDTVNRELMNGQLIPVPGEDGQVDWYHVYARVAAEGLIAYGLKPAASNSSLKPLIVFRPTQRELGARNAIETLKNDVELKIGSSGWLAAQEAFEALMKDSHFRKEGEKVIAAGYSIGGAHLQYFLYQFSDNVKAAFSFNAPSVDKSTADAFADQINGSSSRRKDPLSIYVIRSPLDHVPKFGEKHVGCGVKLGQGVKVELIEVDFQDPKMGWEQQHTRRAFSSDSSVMTCFRSEDELLLKLDNSQRGPDVEWYQRLHYKWGWLAFRFFQCLHRLNQLIHFIIGTSDPDSTLYYKWKG